MLLNGIIHESSYPIGKGAQTEFLFTKPLFFTPVEISGVKLLDDAGSWTMLGIADEMITLGYETGRRNTFTKFFGRRVKRCHVPLKRGQTPFY